MPIIYSNGKSSIYGVITRLFIMYPRMPARIMPESKSSPVYTERRPIHRHEVQAESKVFRCRIVIKSSYPYQGIGNKVVMVKWFYKDSHVKELQRLKGIREVP